MGITYDISAYSSPSTPMQSPEKKATQTAQHTLCTKPQSPEKTTTTTNATVKLTTEEFNAKKQEAMRIRQQKLQQKLQQQTKWATQLVNLLKSDVFSLFSPHVFQHLSAHTLEMFPFPDSRRVIRSSIPIEDFFNDFYFAQHPRNVFQPSPLASLFASALSPQHSRERRYRWVV